MNQQNTDQHVDLPTLHSTVGLPRSGKTTWAKQTGWPVVNPDSIRLALHGQAFVPEAEAMVWVIAQYMVKALFLAGHRDVVLDATNFTKARRAQWVTDKWNNTYNIFTAPMSLCLMRADGNIELQNVIQRMGGQFEAVDQDDFRPGKGYQYNRPEHNGKLLGSGPTWIVS